MTSATVQSANNGWLVAVGGEMGMMGAVREPQIFVAATYPELETILRQVFGQEERVPVPELIARAWDEPKPTAPLAPTTQQSYREEVLRQLRQVAEERGGLMSWMGIPLSAQSSEPEPAPAPEPPPKPKRTKKPK